MEIKAKKVIKGIAKGFAMLNSGDLQVQLIQIITFLIMSDG
jgi:hypothetical protein